MNLKDLKTSSPKPLLQTSEPIEHIAKTRKTSILPKSSSTTIAFNLDEKPRFLPKDRNLNIKKKMSKLSKFFLILFLLVLTVGGSALGYLLYKNSETLKNTGVEGVNLFTPLTTLVGAVTNQDDKPLDSLAKTDNRTNFLLIGVDARNGFTSFRTDTMIIASYNHETKQVVEFSVPRDTQAKYFNSITKLNAIFQFSYNEFKSKMSDLEAQKASFDRLTDALFNITGIKIHYGVMVNFNALKEIVDALGGITVDVDKPLYDNLYPNDTDTGQIVLNFKAGVQTMNGTKALQYARSRETTSDYDRARRQQIVVSAIKDKFLKSSIYSDVSAIQGILDAINKNIKFFKINSDVINELIKSRDVLKDIQVANRVLDPTIGSLTGQILLGGSPVEGAGFLVYPVSKNYDDLKSIVKTYLDNPSLLIEDADIQVVFTNAKRAKEFNKFNNLVLDNFLPFTYLPKEITLAQPAQTPSGTATLTPTTKTTVTNNVNIYLREDKPKTVEFYKKLLESQGLTITIKSKEDLPKELQSLYAKTNIIIEFN